MTDANLWVVRTEREHGGICRAMPPAMLQECGDLGGNAVHLPDTRGDNLVACLAR